VEQVTGRELVPTLYPELAYEVGADVPFFHRLASEDGCQGAWVEGIGEVVTPCEIGFEIYILLVNPGIHISTKWVYDGLTSSDTVANVPPSFETLEQLIPYVTNDLESVVLTRYSGIAELKARIKILGADAALMSGSGSTVFGLFSQKEKRDEALEILKEGYPKYWVCAAEVLNTASA
jgi:4-diphosphocytidyl-2-C-methyl-D-erythritol kinase